MPSRAWARWRRFAHRAAEIQSLVVLTILYWVVVVPIGFSRGTRRADREAPVWKTRTTPAAVTVEEARRQS